jgi:hypothetical protein
LLLHAGTRVNALAPLPPVGCELTDPLAQLLFALCSTVLGPAAGPLSSPVAGHFRCSWKPHPHTRMKLGTLHPEKGLWPIEGFTLRCRVCGGLNAITTSTGSMQRLVMA